MSTGMNDKNAGWSVGQSIALELDLALSSVAGYFPLGALPEGFAGLVRSIPADMRQKQISLLGSEKRLGSVIELAASLTDVPWTDEYSLVTLAIRELTKDEAFARVADRASDYDLAPNLDLQMAERLPDLWMRLQLVVYAEVGIEVVAEDPFARRLQQDIERATRILRDGDLHVEFWHWMDRFYYEFYHPWRRTRLEVLQALNTRALAALGARTRAGNPPEMSWLPNTSPLLRFPELQSAVQTGQLQVFFWVEPFGLADSWALHPGKLLLSFSEPGLLYENFRAFAGDVASRAKALGDPTRLVILRMIRHFGMINTELAEALDLARPTVSIHAKILREAGLIASRQVGRQVRHEIVPSEVRRLFHDLERFLDLPDAEEAQESQD
jgi:DNA-binding transcriptional ArsR family regulator